MRIEEAFGLTIRKVAVVDRLTGVVKGHQVLPPPPNVLRVLGELGHRQETNPPGHGAKTQKRRSKRRRLRRRETFLRRQTLRAYGEAVKRGQ